MPNDGDLVDQIAVWVPDEAVRKRILVDNPERLYGFERGPGMTDRQIVTPSMSEAAAIIIAVGGTG